MAAARTNAPTPRATQLYHRCGAAKQASESRGYCKPRRSEKKRHGNFHFLGEQQTFAYGHTSSGVPQRQTAPPLQSPAQTTHTHTHAHSHTILRARRPLCFPCAEQVAFWSAARDPSRDESSLSARLSALSGPRSGLPEKDRRGYLAKCVGLVAGAKAATAQKPGEIWEGCFRSMSPPRPWFDVWSASWTMLKEFHQVLSVGPKEGF